MTERTLHVFVTTDSVEWIVGYDLEDALAAYEELHLGGKLDEDARDPEGWMQLPDDDLLPIIDDDAAPRWLRTRTTKTCGEWAAENGRGFLCSTEW